MEHEQRIPYDVNPAVLPRAENAGNGARMMSDKEQIASYQVVAIRNGQFENPVTVRACMGRSKQASAIYASIWVRAADGRCIAGHGHAGGYGYHKLSAAISDAVHNAGIKQHDFGGCGDHAIDVALGAITRAAGYRKFYIAKA